MDRADLVGICGGPRIVEILLRQGGEPRLAKSILQLCA